MTPLLALVFLSLVIALGVIWTIVRRLDRQLSAMTAGTDTDAVHHTGFVSRDSLVAMARTHPGEGDGPAEIAVVALEIADLTSIRESMGFEAAEQTVREVTRRLQANTRDHQDLAWASDARFLLMLRTPMTAAGTLRVAGRLTERLVQPLTIDDVSLRVRVHAGAALGPAEAAADVVENAEFALGRARQMGQAAPVLYDETEREQAEVAFRRAQALRTAVEHDELRVEYQPILELGSGRLTGVEALLRWENPALGPVSPGDFIPIAEDTGTIIELGSWVLGEACRDVKAIGDADDRPTVSVNVSVHQLRDRAFVDIVQAALTSSELDPSRLILEVTESTFANPVEVTDTLQQLRGFGVRVALDDVGTGYSSLAQLATLPIDVMKLDRMLLAGGIGTDDPAARVFTSVAALGRSLGLDVVAEGVETEDQSAFARRAGCTHEQGFLRSRPVPLVDAMAFARRAAHRSPIR